jgi:hypothetical protein
MMKPGILTLLLLGSLLGGSGCGQATGQEDAIRRAIDAHVGAKGDLNPSAFQTEIQKVTIQGEQAQAEVVFRVKNGPGMMQLGYTLKKAGANWVVVQSNPVGSNFAHPLLDESESSASDRPQSGTAPDIFDAIHQRMQAPPPRTGTGQAR